MRRQLRSTTQQHGHNSEKLESKKEKKKKILKLLNWSWIKAIHLCVTFFYVCSKISYDMNSNNKA